MKPVNEPESAPLQSANEIVVFSIRRESKCAECGEELWPGRYLRLEKDKPLCPDCADLGHLEFLPRGDPALTRRATKYFPLRAVVVRWSTTRKQYERQGILVTGDAIERAEQECLADAEVRKRRRAREAEKRAELDAQYVADFARAIRAQFAGCPAAEATAIAEHASFFQEAVDGEESADYSENCAQCRTVGYHQAVPAANGGFDDAAAALGWHFPTNLVAGNYAVMPDQLKRLANVQCESCHGPGSLHVDAGGGKGQFILNPAKIPKAVSSATVSRHAPTCSSARRCVKAAPPAITSTARSTTSC